MGRVGKAAIALGLAGLALAVPATGPADEQVFQQGGWVVDGASETGQDPHPIRVSVGGAFVGVFSELKVFDADPLCCFQTASVKGSGAIRAIPLPPAQWGATFHGTGYWDCDPAVASGGFVQSLRITDLDLRLDPADPSRLRMDGVASNLESFEASDLVLRFDPPGVAATRVELAYTLVATRDFCIDPLRQGSHEGFRAARMASNYLSAAVHDSNRALYPGVPKALVEAELRNLTGFVFPSPLPLAGERLYLVHDDALPRATPTLRIRFLAPTGPAIVPQGFVTASTDPSADNVDLWGNWQAAPGSFAEGETVGAFHFELAALAPGEASLPAVPALGPAGAAVLAVALAALGCAALRRVRPRA
jgi:hypothetical protein